MLLSAISLSDSIACLHSIVKNNIKFFSIIDPPNFSGDKGQRQIDILKKCVNAFELSNDDIKKMGLLETVALLTQNIPSFKAKLGDTKTDSYISDVLGLRTRLIALIDIRVKAPCDKKTCDNACDKIKVPTDFPKEDAPDSAPQAAPPVKPVLVFDFDLTFIKEHSRGIPVDPKSKTCNIQKIDDTVYNAELNRLKSIYAHIFINSRGVTSSIQDYFSQCNIGKFFTEILAATDREEIGKGDEYWTKRKSEFLNYIATTYTEGNKSKVYFYDDTVSNIEVAKKNGFSNSFVVTKTNNGIDLLKSIK